MSGATSFSSLLVSCSADEHGNRVLVDALAVLGSLQVTSEGEVVSCLREHTYDVVVVDAGAVTRAPDVVSLIRQVDARAQVVVVTAAPHWKIARAVFQAGAIEYMSKYMGKNEMVKRFRQLLSHDLDR